MDPVEWQIKVALQGDTNTPPKETSLLSSAQRSASKPTPNAINNFHDKEQVHVPLALGSVENIRKAIQYLWKHQCRTEAPYPNPASNPRQYIPLNEAINAYGVDLVYGKISTGTTTRRTTCLIRNPYSEKLFLRMLCFTWRMLPLRQTQGKRAYTRRRRFQYLRERFCLLSRHHMLLRDEDLRNLNLANTFNIQTMHPAPGSTLASGIVFCITRGKTNHKGVELYATAYRHKNFLRCTVGGFAFYMLERFQVSNSLYLLLRV
ncbi:MAG: hypothetical protein JOS17DRAFT_9859 [Linnemannia elongata]|nr:MAG: hypothetical protein JOS17DRAFT_9859 [Linnemannia elongata]